MVANVDVNVYPAPTRDWVNSDGLRVKFGGHEGELGRGGTMLGNEVNITEVTIDWTVMALGTDATHSVIFDYEAVFPLGGVLEKADFTVTEVWTGTGTTLNFGLLQRDFTTIVDADGIMAVVPLTVIDLIGNKVHTEPKGGYPDVTTYEGAQLGISLVTDVVLCGHWLTGVPTAGTGLLRIYWRDVLRTYAQT
jgi:hypothetical protein